MNTPIILTAFGTTTAAINSYKYIEDKLTPLLANHQIYWSYSSRMVASALKNDQDINVQTISEILDELGKNGCRQAVVQSLHLFPGYEFHKTVMLSKHDKVTCSVGYPLLTSYQDYHTICSLLKDQLNSTPDTANVLIGHGTDHPTWTSYPALEKIMRKEFGQNLYVGVVEKYPLCDALVETILQDGFKKVHMIPLFLVAGLHYHRDMIGDDQSWRQQFEEKDVSVTSHPHGLSLLPGIENLIHSHITEAIDKMVQSS